MREMQAQIPEQDRAAVAERLARAREAQVEERVAARDGTLWAPAGTPEVADRLGWVTIARRMAAEAPGLIEFARGVQEEGIRDVVLLGMGGSSLAAEVMRRTFQGAGEGLLAAPEGGWPALHVLDSTDAAAILAVEEAIDPSRTLFLVSSKSGGTIEPLSLLAHFWSVVPDGSRFVAITDPGSGLAELAAERGFRRTFLGDPEIGGRYSALSVFGLVPAALIGVDVAGLLAASEGAWSTGVCESGPAEKAWSFLGAALSALAELGRGKLTFVVTEALPGLGLWLEQLVAESTGKEGRGILPVAEEPLGDPEVYGKDRVFMYLPGPGEELEDPRLRALKEAGHPLITLPTEGRLDLGRVFLLCELAVAVAGWGLGINPFDQPNVQQAKDATARVLESYEATGKLPSPDQADAEALFQLLEGAGPPAYVALMAYLQPSPQFDEAVAELRELIRSRSGVTTTFGYGPRFLHSTGQFHKGGPPQGRFLQLLHDGPRDVEIPERPYGFTTLKEAQATGDLQTLRELGRPAERVRLSSGDPAAGLRELADRMGAVRG